MSVKLVRTVRVALVLSLLLLIALPILSCRKSVRIDFRECTSPRGDTAICLIVETELSSAGSVNAWSLYQTREVDPQKLGPDSWATPSGVLSIKLNNGQTVTHTGTLYLDYNTQPPAVQQGKTVLSYRPTNPGALQGFIDTYRNQASSAKFTVNVMLRNVSGGAGGYTMVDVQENHGSNRAYIGSVGGSLPGISEENKDF